MGDINLTIDAIDNASSVFSSVASNLQSAMFKVRSIVNGVDRFIDNTVGKYVAYGNSVISLSTRMGTSLDDASRVVGVLDTYGLSLKEINTLTDIFAQKGKTLSVDTLTTLADQYAALATGPERAQFLIDNFGPNYESFIGLVEGGADRIRTAADKIDPSLMITDEDKQKIQDYQTSVDNLTTAWETLSRSVGEKIIPVLIPAFQGLAATITDGGRAFGEIIQGILDWMTLDYRGAAEHFKNSSEIAAQSLVDFGLSSGIAKDNISDLDTSIGDASTAAENSPSSFNDFEKALEGPALLAQSLSGSLNSIPSEINSTINITSGPARATRRASGGYVDTGGWAMVGDAPGGRMTPFTEWIHALPGGGVQVYNQSQIRGARPMSDGGFLGAPSTVDLSDSSVRRLGAVIASELARVTG